ncbi:MAG: hypothetical protein JSW63_05250, partial [Ignavibacterium sp.]
MAINLKYFLKHGIIYGISNVAVKASGIILLPLYTGHLPLGEFGVLGLIDAAIIILIEVISLGQGQALVMLNNSPEYSIKRKSIFFTISSLTFFICLVFTIFGYFAIPIIVDAYAFKDIYIIYLRIALFVISLRTINNIFLNKLRADEESVKFTSVNIIKLTILIIAASYLLIEMEMGLLGILYAYVISESFTFI